MYQVNFDVVYAMLWCCVPARHLPEHPWRYPCEGKPRDARARKRILCICCKSILLRYVIMEVMPHVPTDGAQDYCWARQQVERLQSEVNDIVIAYLRSRACAWLRLTCIRSRRAATLCKSEPALSGCGCTDRTDQLNTCLQVRALRAVQGDLTIQRNDLHNEAKEAKATAVALQQELAAQVRFTSISHPATQNEARLAARSVVAKHNCSDITAC
jgi:outer membrane murein-binding lipoprotein Lpp